MTTHAQSEAYRAVPSELVDVDPRVREASEEVKRAAAAHAEHAVNGNRLRDARDENAALITQLRDEVAQLERARPHLALRVVAGEVSDEDDAKLVEQIATLRRQAELRELAKEGLEALIAKHQKAMEPIARRAEDAAIRRDDTYRAVRREIANRRMV